MTRTSNQNAPKDLNRFLINFERSEGARAAGKRQVQADSPLYIDSAGDGHTNCRSASTFALSQDGRLTLSGDNEVVISADLGDLSTLFLPFKPAKAIQSQWQIQGDELSWTNPSFKFEPAILCQEGSNVVVYFQSSPVDCVRARLIGRDGRPFQQDLYI